MCANRCLAVLCWLCALCHISPVLAAADCPRGLQIYVVHNCLIWPDQDWELLIRSQLEHLRRTGLTECAITNIALSVPALHGNATYDELESLLESGRQLVHSILPMKHSGTTTGTIISQVHENSYEYPGIHLLWQLAQEMDPFEARDSIFLYFHTKGMVNHGRHTARPAHEADIFEKIIVPWRDVVKVFQSNETVSRVGIHPAPGGWVWFNFWWARTSYLQSLTEPIRTTRRHYYEDYLGRVYNNLTMEDPEPGQFLGCDTCYSLNGACSGHGVVYTPDNMGC